MPRLTPFVCAMAVAACHATEGDIFRTRPDASAGSDASTVRPPEPLASWHIQLTGTLDTSLDVRVYTFDLETPTSMIDGLHAAGRLAICCYFSAGTMEPFRDDASRFPAAALGYSLAGYPDERWVDVRDATVRSIMGDPHREGGGCRLRWRSPERARGVLGQHRPRVHARRSARV